MKDTGPGIGPPQDPRWRYPVVPFRIRRDFTRPDRTLVERFRACSVPDISNRVGRMYTMAGIASLYAPAKPLLGTAITVKCPPGDNLAVMAALDLVQPGDVVVIDAQGFIEWCLGGFEILHIAVRERGAAGFVVNGAYRDAIECRGAGYPVYAKGLAPWSGPKIGPGELNVPVCCGGVIVEPGDLVSGSEEGVVVVPRDALATVADALEQKTTAKADQLQNVYRDYLEDIYSAGLGRYLD